MPNYANAHDLLMCEPPDTSLEEAAAEQALEDAWNDLFASGDWSEIIDEYIAEDQGEVSELVAAYQSGRDADMHEAARRMAVKLETIAEGHIS